MPSSSPIRAAAIAMLLAPVVACAQAPANDAAGSSGTMTFQQFEARRVGKMMALDTDGDGRISRAEYLAGARSGHGDPAQRFQRLDANGDGYLDRGEIDSTMKRRFDRMDSDHDGRISPAERAAMHGARQGGRDGGEDGAPPPAPPR